MQSSLFPIGVRLVFVVRCTGAHYERLGRFSPFVEQEGSSHSLSAFRLLDMLACLCHLVRFATLRVMPPSADICPSVPVGHDRIQTGSTVVRYIYIARGTCAHVRGGR